MDPKMSKRKSGKLSTLFLFNPSRYTMISFKKRLFLNARPNDNGLVLELFTTSGNLSNGCGIIEQKFEDGIMAGNYIALWWNKDLVLQNFVGDLYLTSEQRVFIEECGITIPNDL